MMQESIKESDKNANKNSNTKHRTRTSKRVRDIHGFTMVELIVVIVIILVLGAFLVPSLLKYVSKSQEAVCKSNRATLTTQLNSDVTDLLATGGAEVTDATLQDIIDDSGAKCPSDGTYTANMNEDQDGYYSITVTCSEHDSSGGGGGGGGTASVGQTLLESFNEFINSRPDLHNNAEYRKAFYEKNGNKWPTLTVDGEKYSLQPYRSSSGKTWLYATNKYTDVSNNWHVEMVQNPIDGKWYQATNYNGNGVGSAAISAKTAEELDESIRTSTHSNGNKIWQEVTDYTESN